MGNSDDPKASRSSTRKRLLDVASKQDSGTHEEDKPETTDEKGEDRDARIFRDGLTRKKRSHRSHHQPSSSFSSREFITMVKSDDRIVSQLSKIPEEAWREVVGDGLESMNVDHTESPQTTPVKPQTVDRVHVEPSSRPLSDVEKEYGTDKNRGLILLSTVAVLVGEYEAKEDKSKKKEPRAYSGPINKEEEKFKEKVLSLWVKKFEQRSITSVEPVLQNPNLDSESSPSSSVSGRKKREIVGGLEVEPTGTTPPEWLLNVMQREENGNNPMLILTLLWSGHDEIQTGLLIPINQVQNPDFLTEEETRIIDKQAVSVDFVGPQMNKHEGNLKKWIEDSYFLFVDGWNDVVAANMFKVHDVFHLWSFRSGREKLCLALVPLPPNHGGGSTSGQSGHGNTLPDVESGHCSSTSGECSSLGDSPV